MKQVLTLHRGKEMSRARTREDYRHLMLRSIIAAARHAQSKEVFFWRALTAAELR